MFLSVVYLRECRRKPKQDCAFGEIKSRSATTNWSGCGSGYRGGWNETNELYDINHFVWDVVVSSNLSGSLTFELIVEQEHESILLKIEALLLRLTLNSGWTVDILLQSVNFVNSLLRFHCRYVDLLSVTVKSFSLICLR